MDNGDWRWNHKAGNGKLIGASTEGYRNKDMAITNAKQNGYVEPEIKE